MRGSAVWRDVWAVASEEGGLGGRLLGRGLRWLLLAK